MDLFLLLTSKLAKFHQNRGWVGKKVYQLAWNYPFMSIDVNLFVVSFSKLCFFFQCCRGPESFRVSSQASQGFQLWGSKDGTPLDICIVVTEGFSCE